MVAYNDRRFRHPGDNNAPSSAQIFAQDIREIIWWSTITIAVILTSIFIIY